jgi:hypothetical protein
MGSVGTPKLAFRRSIVIFRVPSRQGPPPPPSSRAKIGQVGTSSSSPSSSSSSSCVIARKSGQWHSHSQREREREREPREGDVAVVEISSRPARHAHFLAWLAVDSCSLAVTIHIGGTTRHFADLASMLLLLLLLRWTLLLLTAGHARRQWCVRAGAVGAVIGHWCVLVGDVVVNGRHA